MPARARRFRNVQTDGKTIRRLREHAGLSQTALAALTPGLSSAAIAMIERGERGGRPATVKAIADALGVTVADLLVPEIEPESGAA